jgi:type IV pilus assembly protein PilC
MDAPAGFYEGLASMLEAGIPIRTALDHLASRASGAEGESLRHLRDQVVAGRPLADAMAERPAVFRPYEVELIRASETSGTLDGAVRSLAANAEAARRVKRKMLSSLAYPLAVLHFAPVPVNIQSLVNGRVFAFIGGCLLMLIPLWCVLGGIWLLLRRAREGGTAARVLLAVPLVGGILRDAALARWARAFAALEDAGVPADLCATRSAAATGLAALAGPLADPAALIRQGMTRAVAYAAAPLPRELYESLAQGEMTGNIAPNLRRSADALEHRLSTRMDTLTALMPVIATIVVGAVVMWIALSFYGSYYGQFK